MEQCIAELTNRVHNLVLDQLDQLVVFNPMYQHLLHSPVTPDPNSFDLPLTFNPTRTVGGVQYARYGSFCGLEVHLTLTYYSQSRGLHLFLLAGPVYLQPFDLVNLAIRHKVSRTTPYPKIALPATTIQWIRPSAVLNLPADMTFNEYSYEFGPLFNRYMSLINCVSYVRFSHNRNHVTNRPLPTISRIRDPMMLCRCCNRRDRSR